MVKWIEAADVPGLLAPGMRVYVQTGAGEPMALIQALEASPGRSAGVTYLYYNVPGVNRADLGALHPDARLECFFSTRDVEVSRASGRLRLLPLHFFDAHAYITARGRYDVALIQLSPPGADGLCSFGITGAFEFDAIARAGTVVAEINPAIPHSPGAPSYPLDRLDYAVEADHPLRELASPPPSAAFAALGRNVASLIDDGDTLELGIGSAPAAILAALTERKDLGIHTGLISDPVIDLMEAGVVTGARKSIDRGRAVTGYAVGSRRLYDALAAGAAVDFRPANYTHGIDVLARIENLRAINTVIEVDLYGQANAEMIGGRLVSGTGGLADFVRGARVAPGGRSILALLATASKGTVSRIVPVLPAGTVTSVLRGDADYVVTEHGVAALRERTVEERARALIAVAAPEFRESLASAWGALPANT